MFLGDYSLLLGSGIGPAEAFTVEVPDARHLTLIRGPILRHLVPLSGAWMSVQGKWQCLQGCVDVKITNKTWLLS